MTIRDRIIGAAAELFSRSGYRGATTRRIAERADVNEVTIFRHFGSKEELIREAIRSVRLPLQALPDEPSSDPRDELTAWAAHQLRGMTHARSMIRTCMGESEEHPEIMQVALERPTQVRAQLLAYLRALQDRGMAARGTSVEPAASLLMGALFMDAMGRDLMPGMFAYGADQAPGLYVDLMLRAIGVATRDAPASANGGTVG